MCICCKDYIRFEGYAFFILPAIITATDELVTLDVVITVCVHLTKKSMLSLSPQIGLKIIFISETLE